MTPDELDDRMTRGEIVALSRDDWEGLSVGYEILRQEDTKLAGLISLLRGPTGLVLMEEPKPGKRVLRPMADEATAEQFIRDRMAMYDRMWDGCGCRIDYDR